jgi:hypothetical protein
VSDEAVHAAPVARVARQRAEWMQELSRITGWWHAGPATATLFSSGSANPDATRRARQRTRPYSGANSGLCWDSDMNSRKAWRHEQGRGLVLSRTATAGIRATKSLEVPGPPSSTEQDGHTDGQI